jgi:purine-binding chemotaxis protein CheW
MNGTPGVESSSVLVFEVGGHRYGLRSGDVREIVRAVSISPLPKAPAIVEGVINVRGEIVAVLDIRERFRLPPKPLEPDDHLVLARIDERLVALRADRALELVSVAAEQIENLEQAVPGAEYVAGVAKLPDGLVLIHDLATFLSPAEAKTLRAAISRKPSRGKA